MFSNILLRCYFVFVSIVSRILARTVQGPFSYRLAQGIIKILLIIIIDYYILYRIANKLLGITKSSYELQ